MFDRWWGYALNNYVTWENGKPVAMDLYYDPVAKQHLASPFGLVAPVWYLAPQRRDFAEGIWTSIASATGLLDDSELRGLDDPRWSSMLAWHSGEFIEGRAKARLWDHLAPSFQPTWDYDRGEFTFRFGLDEQYPRGQLNARAMAGWVCTPGAWHRIFNDPNLSKFTEPSISGVDFPKMAMREARWDGRNLHLAVHPQNASLNGARTSVLISGLSPEAEWTLLSPAGETLEATIGIGATEGRVELVADGGSYQLQRSR